MGKAEYGAINNAEVVKKSTTVNVEANSDISCEVRDVLSLQSSCVTTGYECLDGEIKFSGRIIFNVVYLLEGEIRRKELGVDFSDSMQADCLASDKATLSFNVENVSCEKNDRIKIVAQVTVKAEVERCKTKQLLTGGEDYYFNKKTVTLTEQKCCTERSFTLDDEFECGQIKNVLSTYAQGVITSCQCGINTVICDGEIILTIALLPINEKSDIIKEYRVIPFRLELEGDGVNVDDVSFASVTVGKTALKVFVDEGKEKSTISSQISISLRAKVYGTKELVFVDDLFSTEKELSLAKEKVEIKKVKGENYACEKTRGKAFCEVMENARLITCLDDRVYGVTFKKEKNKIIADGVLSCYCLFEVNNQTVSKLAEMPFSVAFDCDDDIENLYCITKGINAKLRNGEVELESEIAINYEHSVKESFVAVTAMEEGKDLPKCDSAFSVYIPDKNDGLWEICKALKVSPDTVTEQNDVTFPLKENQKIIVYRRI